ncbi:MAG TPA: hypothetical protein V6D06_06320 [Trichocoleus sp.]
MSFTDEEIDKIRHYFGYPAATGWRHQIRALCDSVSRSNEEVEQRVRSQLQELNQLDRQLRQQAAEAAQNNAAGKPPLPAEPLMALKQAQGERVELLSGLLELPIHRTMFRGGGSQSSRRLR